MQKNIRQQLENLDLGLPAPSSSGMFGATIEPQDAKLVLLEAPWEVTTSYGRGTVGGPEAMRQASHQLDLWDPKFVRPYWAPISYVQAPAAIFELNSQASKKALEVIAAYDHGDVPDPKLLNGVNQDSQTFNDWLKKECEKHLDADRFVGIVGGDHSVPLALIQLLDQRHQEFGILHFDAHHDLRKAYEGFEFSHASIFYNVLATCPNVRRLVSVGIRDTMMDEVNMALEDDRIRTFYDHAMQERMLRGESFASISSDILQNLPKKVYVSFDIDGLSPDLCPSTGTPVPGGLSFNQAVFLIYELVARGHEVIGFDLCEVAPSSEDEWDANVGARLLYKLCGALTTSNRLT